jgi:hypothetical protein
MNATELLAAIDDLRDELAEAKRYVRRAPADARNAVERVTYKLGGVVGEHPHLNDRVSRTIRNLDWGLQGIATCPSALEGAIDLASFELAWVRGLIEKEMK